MKFSNLNLAKDVLYHLKNSIDDEFLLQGNRSYFLLIEDDSHSEVNHPNSLVVAHKFSFLLLHDFYIHDKVIDDWVKLNLLFHHF